MMSSVAQFERDVPLWNNKVFLDQPMLIKEVSSSYTHTPGHKVSITDPRTPQDGPIAKYRRWVGKNFYSANSEKVARERAANTGSIDW